MRYELHCNGQVFQGDYEYLLRVAKGLPQRSQIYKIVQSKFPPAPVEKVNATPKFKKRIYGQEVLPYNEAEKCFELLMKGKTRKEIARQMYCSMDKLKVTLRHYEFSENQSQYEKMLIQNEKDKNIRVR